MNKDENMAVETNLCGANILDVIYAERQQNILRHKGLVTNYGEGGATKREGGHVKFYAYEKGGQKKF